MRPIFLLSSPRAGSTLVQRVLAAHPAISTVSEPWLLLPLLAPLYPNLPGADRRDARIHGALEDLFAELPNGRDEYRSAVRELALRVYSAIAAREDAYFLDKSPVYHLVADEIRETFPDAKLIYLWRNPLSLVASSVGLFGQGRWEVNRYTMALFQSIDDLTGAFRRAGDRAFGVRYEDLVGPDTTAWPRLMAYLELDFEPDQLSRFGEVELKGRMGDPPGRHKSSTIDPASLHKWRGAITNPVRKAWCRRYLAWIGSERLELMGYRANELAAELEAVETSWRDTPDDVRRLGAAFLREAASAHLPPHAGGASTWHRLLTPRPASQGPASSQSNSSPMSS